jgi:hypothetical protein
VSLPILVTDVDVYYNYDYQHDQYR